MCSHSTIYQSYICVHVVLHVRAAICVLIVLYMCPHTTIHVCAQASIKSIAALLLFNTASCVLITKSLWC